MANNYYRANKKEFNKKVFAGKFALIILVGIILGVSCLFSKTIEPALGIGKKEDSIVNMETIENSKLKVHYIDVGQGDATFIFLPDGTNMLIDTGTEEASDKLVKYIKDLGVTQIDYFILTHSDSDHSGGADEVFSAFEIKTIYRPFQIAINQDGSPIPEEDLSEYYLLNKESCNAVSTATYRGYIKSAHNETYTENGAVVGSDIIVSYDGLKIESKVQSETFVVEFFAPFITIDTALPDVDETFGYPVDTYGKTNRNNISPIILLEYNQTSFLFTGDAGTAVEEDLISSLETEERARFEDIDVYQAGHHGANNSNSQEFINLTTPDYVVVSAGKDNSYGHPTPEFIEKVNGYNHSVNDYLLRTDTMGNIIFGFDSENKLAYTAFTKGEGGVTIYWWEIALGLFVVISIIIISVKVTKNKKATAKRVVSKSRQVSQLYKKK